LAVFGCQSHDILRVVHRRRLASPGRKRVIPYSIQTLKRLKPELFRQDLITLFDLLQQKKIKPLIAHRFSFAEARQAQEMLAKGGVTGKIVLVLNGSSLESGEA
jgi:NADPH:quinone reductase-like Zn-dependent oxidoreductase